MRFPPPCFFAALLAAAPHLALHAAPEIALEQPAGTSLVANRVVGFGSNSSSQITIPSTLSGVVDISAGGNNSLVLKIDGTLVGWGSYFNTPVSNPAGLSGVVAISGGAYHSNALKSDGSVVTWGGNTAIPASPLTNRAVAAGAGWSVAIKSDSTVVAWGENNPGVPAGMSGLVAVAAGDYHFVGLKADGTVVAWGNNSNGQSVVPAGLGGVVAIAAGHRHSLALKGDGTVVAWGFNDNGGGLPVSVPAGLNGVVAIDAGGPALALKNSDTIVGWGRNAEGQLTPPAGLTKVRKIATGDYHSLALAGSVAAYDPQILGAPGVTRTFTIKNTGPDPLTISSVALFGADASEFTLNTTGLLTTLPALTGQTTVTVTFNPTTLGAKKTFLRVLNNDSDEATFEVLLTGTGTTSEIAVTGNTVPIADGDTTPSAADHTDFGGVVFAGNPTAARTYTITNSGTGTLALGNVTVSGTHSADFSVTTPPAASVAAGASTTFQVTFNPSASGIRTATLSFTNNDADESPFDFAIQGTGLEPEVAVSEASVDIPNGSTPANSFADVLISGGIHGRTFTVANLGTSPLTLGTLAISGPNAADFYVNIPLASTVTVGASTTFQIVFDPTANGLRQATLSFTTNDADENPFTFALRGTGIDPEISVLGNGVNIASGDTTPYLADHSDFDGIGSQYGSLVRTFTVTNSGVGPLTLGSVSITGSHAGDFAIISQPATSVAQGGFTTFQVRFIPSARGLRSATLQFTTNDANENPFSFAIQGTGILPEISIEDAGGTPLITGGVTAWGSNTSGQLNVPADLAGVVAVDSSANHTVALKSDGTIVAWGLNSTGQLNIPAGLRNVVSIGAGSGHTLVLLNDRTIRVWGRNNDGESNIPWGLSDVVAIAAGGIQNSALLGNGGVVRWGYHSGNDTGTTDGLTGSSKIAAGDGHGLGLKPDGTVIGWGRNYEQQLVPPAGLNNVVALAGGGQHSMALKSDGTIVVWGENGHSEIGGAPYGISGFTAIAAGTHHDVALKADGTIFTWGDNSSGQATIPAGLIGVRAIAAGAAHTVAVTDATVAFGTRLVGTPSPAKTFTIKNIGLDPLTVGNLTITGANASDFPLDLSGLSSILPATTGQTTFTVTFTPGGPGTRNARLRVLNDDGDEGTYDILLSGDGLALTPREIWRQTWFGATANSGVGADDADPDGDGLVNLIEYAFGLDPTASITSGIPAIASSDDTLTWDFIAPAGVSDITYGAEWSITMEPGTWTPVSDTGTAPRHLFTIPRDERSRLFLRMVITPAP